MKTKRLFASLMLGLGLALTLLWLLGGIRASSAGALPSLDLGPAVTIAVETTADEQNANDICSLREAIINANNDDQSGSADCSAGNGADTIKLPSGTYTLSIGGEGENAAAEGDLDVTDDLVINGTGAISPVIDGGRIDRIFHVSTTASVEIRDVIVQGGYVNETGSDVGGGIYNQGTLLMEDCIVRDNEAESNGGGIHTDGDSSLTLDTCTLAENDAERGGGAYVDTVTATLEMTGGVVDNNWAMASGGGVYVDEGSATLNGTEVVSNSARDDHGGGVCVSDGSVTLNGAELVGNSAGQRGGGVYAHRGVAALSETRLESNRADTDGGGLHIRRPSGSAALSATHVVSNSAGNNGGGVYVHIARATLTGTEVLSNSAGDIGGGVYVHRGSAMLTGTQVVSNSATNGGGLLIGNSQGAITATNGCIVFNSDTAVGNVGGGTLDASDNWWGMPDGPSGPGGTGRGDSVGSNVTFNPYKSSQPPGCRSYMDLLIAKDVTPTTDVAKDGVVTYTVTLNNRGPLSDTSVVFTDTLPDEVDFAAWVVSPTGTLLDSGADEITWSGTVTNGEGLTWTFTAVHIGDYSDVVTNTGEFSGTVRAGEDDAVFTVVGPEITVHPSSLSFGSQDVDAGPTLPQTVTITNDGSADLSFTAPVTITGSDAGAFVIVSDSGENSLPPGSTRTVRVSFDPMAAGAKSASLSIQSDDSDEPTVNVALSGTGTETSEPGYGSDPPPGSSIDVGAVNVGSTGSATLTISETGDATLVLTPTLSGPDAGDFGVTPSTLTILDGEPAKDLTIACTPSVTRTLAATLTVAHNATGSPALYPLSCTGEPHTILLPLVIRNN